MSTKTEIVWKGKLQPTWSLPYTQPMALTSAGVRRVVDTFMESGTSTHSSMGGTLWALLDYLQWKGIPYTLKAWPGKGYYVERLAEL